MNPAELWIRVQAGEPLSPEEDRALLAAFENDPAFREEVLQDVRADGLLRAAGGDDGFARAFFDRLHADRQGDAFVRRVLERKRTRRRARPSKAGWAVGVAAAVLVVVAIAALSGPGRPVEAPRPKPVVKAPERRPDPPAPTPEPVPEPPKVVQAEEKKDPEAELARIAEEFRAKVEAAKSKAPEVPSPTPPPPAPKPAEPAPATTAAPPSGLATIERAQEAAVVANGTRTPLHGGEPLLAGQGLEVVGSAVVVYPDGTRLELGAGTAVERFDDDKGKRLFLAKGALRAAVAKQPKDREMVFATPHGDATVIGTTLRLAVAEGTRLDVEEGRVLLKNKAGRSTEVAAGHFAIAAPGVPMVLQRAVRPNPALERLTSAGLLGIDFGPANTTPPDGFLVDSGAVYDEARGYGWKEPVTPVHDVMDMGRPLLTRTPKKIAGRDPLRDTILGAGWKDIVQTWTFPVPDGRYLVTVGVGQRGFQQGPHHVRVEDVQVIDQVATAWQGRPEFFENSALVRVRDGELTMVVGGGGRTIVDSTSDSILTHLIIRRVKD